MDKKSNAIVIGASASAINMSAKWLCSKNFGYPVETNSVYDGIGLGNFSVLSHLSQEMNIYASNKDCALRVTGDKIDVLGSVYLISHSEIMKLDETF